MESSRAGNFSALGDSPDRGPPPLAAPAPDRSEAENAAAPGHVIFVGGAGDQNSAIVYREYERFKFARPDISSRYFSHDQNREIGKYINTLPDGAPVTIIGHSWGGDTAAQVALNVPKRIIRSLPLIRLAPSRRGFTLMTQ